MSIYQSHHINKLNHYHQNPKRKLSKYVSEISNLLPKNDFWNKFYIIQIIFSNFFLLVFSYGPSLEHRTSETQHHPIQFLASRFSSCHIFPNFSTSCWTLSLQVTLEHPCLRVPYRFQSRACQAMWLLSFLIVCPIQLHLLSQILTSIGRPHICVSVG